MTASTYTKTGTKATTNTKLESSVFDIVPENHELLKQAYQSYLANGRPNLSKTLRRGEVSGGGKKPWKQKGTGRARFGSIRVPIWRGGGITFGPLGIENYSKKLSVSAKRTAIRQALSIKSKANSIIIMEDILISDGKTSTAKKLLEKINSKGRILIVVDSKTPELLQSTRNIQDVEVTQAQYLNTYILLNADTVIITNKALEIVNNWLATTSKGANQ
jgi:large subunit ribosomal protein L4